MDNPLTEQIEELSSMVIRDANYKGKQVVLLDDAITALEDLEVKIWKIYEMKLNSLARSELAGNI